MEAGVYYRLEQADGYCDGSTVKTELFKIISFEGDEEPTVTYVHGVEELMKFGDFKIVERRKLWLDKWEGNFVWETKILK